MLDFERTRTGKLRFCRGGGGGVGRVTEDILHYNYLGVLKKGHLFFEEQRRKLEFEHKHCISKQGTKVFFGGGVGEGGGGGKDRILKGNKK